ncbi:indolepyruvate ferredoxin oxidoreductase family protein [Sphingobium chlorophenolicum]|nr:indolepyruvate ferredoxin oxidoreductase family protein [Sphingobium chlorophenolicum]
MISGTEALVYGMLAQADADRAQGLHTAGFVSGYRGSPFGNVDLELWRMQEALDARGILFQPGLNEDMAATACWGTQQVPLLPNPRYDGVFALWYGKGPGVDRTGDVFKHGNLAGTSPMGGVVAMAGDDHGCKSSSTAHQSEHAFVAASMPVMNPSSITEYRDLLPAAVAMSRFASVWVGFKCVTEIVEASSAVDLGWTASPFELPDVDKPQGGFHISRSFTPLAVEESLHRYRLPAVRRFVAANGFDRVTLDAPDRSLGIIAPGKAHVDVHEALRLLRLEPQKAAALGLRILKPLVTWPLEPGTARGFCEDHREILVVEEKRSLVEGQIAQILLGIGDGRRPALSGKSTPQGAPLLPEYGEISAQSVAIAIGGRLEALGLADESLREAMKALQESGSGSRAVAPTVRAPMFCSGCPHNRSTQLPEGSEAFGGIGCHGMAMWIPELRTSPSTHMGGEGGTWLGIAPFGGPSHMFQNMGDGTYAHSGLLAIRAAIAAKSNITYKILCNAAVAMTGGQPVEGSPDAAAIARQTLAEGAIKVVVVSEDISRFTDLPPEIEVHPRDALMRVQRELRDIVGVTILIYDQGCAAERRRLRKRGEYPDLPIRTLINSDVCEGCGDCNRKSSCVSVLPIETELGTKRVIDQESCNKDYTCVEGFCPSFLTVVGGKPRQAVSSGELLRQVSDLLVEPDQTVRAHDTFNIILAGIGGTGVVSLGGVLSRAAAMEGQAVLTFDVTGVSQKNGAVFTHIRLLSEGSPDDFRPRIPREQLDLLVGCDIVAASSNEVVQLLAHGRTRAVVNTDLVPTADFQRDTGFDRSIDRFQSVFTQVLDADAIDSVSPGSAVTDLIGAGPLLNIFLLGAACQRGLLPLRLETLEKAVGEGRGGKRNLLAFRLGRLSIHDRAALDELVGAEERVTPLAQLPFEALIARAKALLTSFQSTAYADRYEAFVRAVKANDPHGAFAHAVALNLFKLMRYKDEYEVARLYAAPEFQRRIAKAFEGDAKLRFNLAPPLLSFRKNDAGEPRKIQLGGWMMPVFRVMQHFKMLRGTPLDPFGYTSDRRTERRLIREYQASIDELASQLSSVDYQVAVEIASLPDSIRGYGPVKDHSIEAANGKRDELSQRLHKAPQAVDA